MLQSVLVQTVALLPGAAAGEGVAGGDGRRVPAATRGQPCLGVEPSSGGKVGEGAETGSIGVDQLHRPADTATWGSTRYKDH